MLSSGVSFADPYDNLAWGPVDPRLESMGEQSAPNLSVLDFRRFFRHKPVADFQSLLKECGIPSEEWKSGIPDNPNQTKPARMPQYQGGHLFRYKLSDDTHVYIWTNEEDGLIMRADSFYNSGRIQPLYLKSL